MKGKAGAGMATRAARRGIFHWSGERLFFGGMGLLVLALVFVGFAPSFFLRGSVTPWRSLGPISPLVIVHAILFSAWVVFYIVQTALISARRHRLHRTFGTASLALAVAMVVTGVLVAAHSAAEGRAPPGIDPMTWIWISLTDIILFVGLVWSGYRERHDAQVHKRLMLLSTLVMLGAALGRIPMFPPGFLYGEGNTLIAVILMLPLVAWDLARRGRVMLVTVLGIGAIALAQVLRVLLWETEAARSAGASLVGLLT